MCIEFHLKIHPGENPRRFEEAPVFWTDSPPARAWDIPIQPTDSALMIRVGETGGLEAVVRRWWLVPAFHKGPASDWKTLCANAEIETVDTSPIYREAYATRRALIPLTAFIAYEEPPGWRRGQPKRRWEVSWQPADANDQVRYFAAVWDRSAPSDQPLESFAIVTRPAGPDLAAMALATEPAVLTLAQGLDWLNLDGPGKAVLTPPSPAGTYGFTDSPREQVMSRELRRAL